ncbi:uncharacterized protein LOC117171759 [Belonocnema kinseyi]|uniref:uncharacterized protein LOC117171759 n=1 Tax=Belonocnema kinseyi TaxID=2817044 RepID=UPI00143D090C|nr:uncharacterized protein LOC117171759 [Belonocnema kinseyi]
MYDFLEFYPNECTVCHKTQDLKRCGRCQMISYCGSPHQKLHWQHHKDLCRVISDMTKERKVSHLYEKFRGADLTTWKAERNLARYEAELRTQRPLTTNENFMFKFPRACFVCYESRQDLLTNCPGCPSASFCREHPSSPVHDKDCAIIRGCHQHSLNPNKTAITSMLAISSIVKGTRVTDSSKLPTSLREYFCEFARSQVKITEDALLFLSDMFTTPLTIFSALKKVNHPQVPVLNLHVGNIEMPTQLAEPWEALLHLLPNVKVLNILIVEYHYDVEKNCETQIKLCARCKNSRRKITLDYLARVNPNLSYAEYMKRPTFKEPDLLIYANEDAPEEDDERFEYWKRLIRGWSKLNCPIIMTNFRESENKFLKKSLISILEKFETVFDGYNPFTSLAYIRAWEDGGVGLSNQFMTIFKTQTDKLQDPSTLELVTKQVEQVSLGKEKISTKKDSPSFFYASVCSVCHSANTSVTCNRCKMIFYCGKNHQSEDQLQHKDICKVILGMLNESGAPNLFDKMKKSNSDEWLRTKIELMLKAKSKLGRTLFDHEVQMFLFPKTCFVCHESDLSVLRKCGCGTHLCKAHKEDPEHKKLCSDLFLAFKLTVNKERISKVLVKALPTEGSINLPSSMEDFMDSQLKLKEQAFVFYGCKSCNVANSQRILLSDCLTRPLTLLWALKKLDYKTGSSMIVHVVGATNWEISAQEYWKIILHWLQNLKTLKIVFIGPEIFHLPSDLESALEFPNYSLAGKSFKVESHALRYEEYFQSEFFVQPNIVVGFNLDIHESEFGISESTWEDMIRTLKKVNTPFILTAGTKEGARKDHRRFFQHLGKTVDSLPLERNPYAGSVPERDFETERLRFSNQYTIIFKNMIK